MMAQDPSRRPDALRVYEDLTRAIELETPPTATTNARYSMPVQMPPDLSVGLGLVTTGTPPIQSSYESPRRSTYRPPDRRATISTNPRTRPFSTPLSTEEEDISRQSFHVMARHTIDVPQQTPMSGINSPLQHSRALVGQKDLPVASVDEALNYIRRKKADSRTPSLRGQEWLKRLHGRDQVLQYQ
jgi:hypothetical protein